MSNIFSSQHFAASAASSSSPPVKQSFTSGQFDTLFNKKKHAMDSLTFRKCYTDWLLRNWEELREDFDIEVSGSGLLFEDFCIIQYSVDELLFLKEEAHKHPLIKKMLSSSYVPPMPRLVNVEPNPGPTNPLLIGLGAGKIISGIVSASKKKSKKKNKNKKITGKVVRAVQNMVQQSSNRKSKRKAKKNNKQSGLRNDSRQVNAGVNAGIQSSSIMKSYIAPVPFDTAFVKIKADSVGVPYFSTTGAAASVGATYMDLHPIVNQLQIQRDMFGTSISKLASAFTEYRLVGDMEVTFEPTLGTASAGIIGVGYSTDPFSLNTSSSSNTWPSLNNIQWNKRGPVGLPFTLRFPVNSDWHYIDQSDTAADSGLSASQRQNYAGVLAVASPNTFMAGADIGILGMKGKLEFREINPQASQASEEGVESSETLDQKDYIATENQAFGGVAPGVIPYTDSTKYTWTPTGDFAGLDEAFRQNGPRLPKIGVYRVRMLWSDTTGVITSGATLDSVPSNIGTISFTASGAPPYPAELVVATDADNTDATYILGPAGMSGGNIHVEIVRLG
jgi:hypothetical protein